MTARLDIPPEAAGAAQPRTAVAARPPAFLLILGALAVLALLALAAAAWRQQARLPFQPGPLGASYAVQLQNGQMFYGVLRDVGAAQVQLSDVYYVQPYTMPNGQQGNRVVSRQKNDWHGPTLLTIPVDRVVYVEAIGPQSQLARLIAQDQHAAPVPVPGK